MLSSSIDLAVLLVFFTRKDTLEKVFERIREARPSELFLYQDGPRSDHPEDAAKLEACRAVVEQIDWDCKVHRLYQEKNYGPDASGYLADRWAFSQADKCLVLEDDVVPARSFFAFCKEMLDRYEHDERVMLISGWNCEEKTQGIESDYFFSPVVFSWGWASWSRVVNQWDPTYSFLDSPELVARLQNYISEKGLRKNGSDLECWRLHRRDGYPHFETVMIAHQRLHHGLTLYPASNMVCNIGLGGDAAHYSLDLACMARGDRRIFTMLSYDLDVEHLRHPQQVEEHEAYRINSYRIRAYHSSWCKAWRCLESFCLCCLHGRVREGCACLFGQVSRFLTGRAY